MTLNEMISSVYTITNRDDLVDETLLAIKAATLKVHNSDFYLKDLFESGVAFDTSSYTQSLNLRGLISSYRSLKYIRKYDNVGGVAGKKLDIITPGQIFDDYGVELTDIAYEAGSVLQMKMSTSEQYFLFGCYVHPNVTVDGYSSWIADEYPFAIIYDAAAKVLGDLEKIQARDYNMAQRDIVIAELKASNIETVGN